MGCGCVEMMENVQTHLFFCFLILSIGVVCVYKACTRIWTCLMLDGNLWH
jgi:hypothetical protein